MRLRLAHSRPPAMSHTYAVLPLAVAIRVPSGINATLLTLAAKPTRRWLKRTISPPLSVSHTRATPVIAGGSDPRAIGTKRDVSHRVLMDKVGDFAAAGQLPYPRGLVVAGGSDPRTISTERDGMHPCTVHQTGEFTTADDVPHPRDPVTAGGSDPRAIGTEHDSRHHAHRRTCAPMHEPYDFTAAGGLPHPRDPVVARGRDPRTIGTKRHAVHALLMPEPR